MWSQKILTGAQLEELLSHMNVSRQEGLHTDSSVSSMDGSRLLTILAYCSLFLIGLGGNAWVAYVIGHVLRRRSRESPRSVQVYILALCLGDFVILTFSLFLIMDLLYNAWVIESVLLCRLYLSSESLNKFYVPFVLASLSYFCYAKICRPHPRIQRDGGNIQFMKIFDLLSSGSTRSAATLISLCAACAFILCIPVYAYGDLHYLVFDIVINETADHIDQSNHIDESTRMMIMPKCAFSPPESLFTAFIVYSFVGGFAIPASLFTYFYSAILWHSRSRQRHSIVRLGLENGGHHKGTGGRRSKFWRVAKTASGLVSFYLLCWTPYWMVNLYHAWSANQQHEEGADSTPSDFAVVFGYFVHMLPYVNCTGYPIIYTLLNRQILNAYKNAGRRTYLSGESVTTAYNEDISPKSARSNRYCRNSNRVRNGDSCVSVNGNNAEIETILPPTRVNGSSSDISFV